MAEAMVVRAGGMISGGVGTRQSPSFSGVELDGFRTGVIEDQIESSYRLAAATAILIPLDVVTAFGMVLVLTPDPDMIADNPPLRSTTGAKGHLTAILILLMTLTRSAYCFALAICSKPRSETWHR